MRSFVAGAICFLGLMFLLSSCTMTQKVRDGRTAMELKQYAVAAALYQKEYDKAKQPKDKALIAFELGQAYRLLRQFDESARWFERAESHEFGVDAVLWNARMQMQLEKYAEAQRTFLRAGQLQNNERLYASDIQAARTAATWSNEAASSPYKVRNLPFNSLHYDYGPAPMPGKVLIFTSDRETAIGNRYYKMTGNKFSSLFQAQTGSPEANRFGEMFNSQYNDASLCMNPDQTMAAFIRCGSDGKADDFCKIYYSRFEEGSWTEPLAVEFTLENVNYRTPAFSSDGRLLLFASDVQGGAGGFDLYVSEFFQGIWQDPVSVGSNINTSFDELSPHMHRDTLYFSSDRTGGMGGLDVYKAFLLDGKWSSPQNLKAPVNSGFDDFNFVVDTFAVLSPDRLLTGYLVSNRRGGMGADDIYGFDVVRPKIDSAALAADKKDSIGQGKITLEIITQEKEFNVADDPNSGVRFRKPMGLTRVVLYENNVPVDSMASNAIGQATFRLRKGASYRVIGSKDGYLSGVYEFTLADSMLVALKNDTLISGRVLLEKIYINKEIVLENIYYDYDRWEIRPDARPTLDTLARLLQITPSIKILLGSHTDCRGTEEYNQSLSQRRAESALRYLEEKGISPGRLKAIGYGESKPVVTCICETCTEAEHQQNRRTTFAITE
jgi:peptidoglycan-associated lipoprotein